MKVLITGASGFVGKYVVAVALKVGYEVRAVFRPKTDETRFSWHTHPNLEIVRFDLRQRKGLADVVSGVDAVIHLAATKSGGYDACFTGTVIGTENLLIAMQETEVKHLVFTSTFSLYDYKKIPRETVLDENSPLIENPLNRDAYAQTKLIQEKMIRTYEQDKNATVTIIRPGMIYGREVLWHALLGAKLGEKHWLKIGGKSTLPITYVENCAEVIVKVLTEKKAFGQTINIVDDELPTQQSYINELLKREQEPPRLIPVSWSLMQGLSNLAWFFNKRLLRGRARLPGILVPAQLQARFRPLQYSNRLAKSLLNWTPRYSFEGSLNRSYSSQDLISVGSETISTTSAN
jgi:nucleoside-diphosphate-sugar epimerase